MLGWWNSARIGPALEDVEVIMAKHAKQREHQHRMRWAAMWTADGAVAAAVTALTVGR